MKKRILSCILIAVMLFTLTACGGKTEDKEPAMGAFDSASLVYTNEFLGVKCQLEENWDVFDTERMSALQGLPAGYTNDEELKELLDDEGSAQLFYAQADEGFQTLNIAVEDLGKVYGKLIDEKQYAQLSLDQVEPALEGVGFSVVSTEITSMNFAGSSHTAIEIHGKLQDLDFYETLVCVKAGKYMALVTAGSYDTDVTKDLLGFFSSL